MSLSKDIAKCYKGCSKKLRKKLDKWAKEINKIMEPQLKLLQSGAITKKAYDEWCKVTLLNSRAVAKMTDDLLLTLTAADAEAVKILSKKIPEVYLMAETKALYDIDRVVGLGASFTLHNKNAIKTAMAKKLLPTLDESADVIKNSRRLNVAITHGILRGQSIKQIAKMVVGVAGLNSKYAIRNARTAVNSAENAAKMVAYEEAEENGLEMTKIWVATLDERTRDSHAELDGEEVGIHEKFSNDLMYPADPDGDPAEVYNCRCTMVTSVNGHRVNMENRVNKTGMSYEQWKAEHHR